MPDLANGDATVDPAEIAKFEALAEDWWDPQGRSRGLHLLGPARLDFITRQIAAEFDRDLTARGALAGLSLADIGCGGGLVCEPMARLGAAVTGVDASEAAIAVARGHAARQGLAGDYRESTAEALAATGARFDVVLTLEIVEHTADPPALVTAAATLLKPGGLMVLSTLNRTARSFALAVVGAEYVLGWLPRGTHDWRRFLPPEEAARLLADARLQEVDRKGFVFDPLAGQFRVSARDLSVNYAIAARKLG